MTHIRLSLAIVGAALIVAVPAYAGGSTLQSGYGSTPQNVLGTVVKAPKKANLKATHVAPVKSSGTLPFTGMDLGLFALVAIVVGGTGVAFRRIGRQSH
jgi:hypothetical protein